jgi:glycine/serine hydroxymethyltransferase
MENLITTQQPTRVITITDSHSNLAKNPIGRINTTISKIRFAYPNTEFYAAGVNIKNELTTTKRDLLEEELKALSGYTESHFSLTDTNNSTVFMVALFDLLETAGVLCPNESKFMK